MKNIRYWKISPWDWGKDPEGWEIQWDECLKEKKIAIGWGGVSDLSGLSLDQIRNSLQDNGHYKGNAKQLFNFRNIGVGDIVVANRGQKVIAGIGKVVGKYYFNQSAYFDHTLPVKWLDTERRKIEKQMDWLPTVIPLTKQKAQELGVVKISKTIQKYEEGIKEGAKFSEQVVKTRTFQQIFRKMTLESYESMCAVCDVNDDSLLRAGHIVPVKDDPDIAADLSNGICLCVLHDVAFERGIFSISDQYKILVADSWLKTTSSVLNSMISKLNGNGVRLPVQQLPNKSYIKRHRERNDF